MKASNIIGMEVINLYEGQVYGYVKNLVFNSNYKKVSGLIVYSDKLDKQFYLSIKRIYKINDIVFTKNASVYDENYVYEDNSPINLPAYLTDGKSLGLITDVELDDKFDVINYITTVNSIKNDIAKITQELIIFNCENCKIKTSSFAPRKKKNIALTNDGEKTISNTNNIFLVGRKVTKDIFTFNNELLVKSGTTITERIVRLARLNGKLRELALNVQ